MQHIRAAAAAGHHHGHMAPPPQPPQMHPNMGDHSQPPPPHMSAAPRAGVGQPAALHHNRLNHHQPHGGGVGVGGGAGSSNYHPNTISANSMQKIPTHLSGAPPISNANNSNKCNHSALPPQQQPFNHLVNAQAVAAAAASAAISYNHFPPHMAAQLGGYPAQPPPAALMGGKPPQPPPPHHTHTAHGHGPPSHYFVNTAKPNKYPSNNSVPFGVHQSNYRPPTAKPPPQKSYPKLDANGNSIGRSAAGSRPPHKTTPSANASEVPNSNNIVITTEVSEGPKAVITGKIKSPPAGKTAGTGPQQTREENRGGTEIIDTSEPLSNEENSHSRSNKDKTPMCLVNELSRYNKVTHQYRLTGERGPAHCKTFTVTLKLGEEEYSADGYKIKKAQHLAASKAIEETKYKHPPPKLRRNDDGSGIRTHITPTVELNALAMKMGQRTYYLMDPTQIPPQDPLVATPEYGVAPLPGPHLAPFALRARNGNFMVPPQALHPGAHVPLAVPRGIYGQRTGFTPKFPPRFALPPPLGGHLLHGPPAFAALPVTPSKITLFVGKQKFVGIGRTLQQAKHDAAARALQVLKTQPFGSADEGLDDSMDEGDKKSPISQVHEIGIKRELTVHFKVLREEGPAHMKNFITACIVGSIVTEGEGNGKKISKKRAAEKMLAELQKLPPLTPTKQTPMKRIKMKTPGKNPPTSFANGTLIGNTPSGKGGERRKRAPPVSVEKEKEKSTDQDDAENPITKLIQLQQNRKEKEPIFELIAKNGNESSRRREFVMEVSASGSSARGTGNSKKLAKRNAAQALLEILEKLEPKPQREPNTENHSSGLSLLPSTDPDVPMVSTPAGPVPGILILRQSKKPTKKKDIIKAIVESKEHGKGVSTTTGDAQDNNGSETNSKEVEGESALNISSSSNTSGVSSNSSNGSAGGGGSKGEGGGAGSGGGDNPEGNGSSSSRSSSTGSGVHMKEQLLYLSKLLDFEVNFSDYPKGNHNEFLTIVTLSTNPPQICHGVGKSPEESQNDSARNALKILSELKLKAMK